MIYYYLVYLLGVNSLNFCDYLDVIDVTHSISIKSTISSSYDGNIRSMLVAHGIIEALMSQSCLQRN